MHFELYSHNISIQNRLNRFKKSERGSVMPRKLTEEEIEAVKGFMYERALDLIIRKGVTSITLDDILDAVQMAKGTFYKYYDSKELFLYEVIKNNERMLFEKLIHICPILRKDKDSVLNTMNDYLTEKDCLFMTIQPGDTEFLLRKMPETYRKKEEEKSRNNFLSFCDALGIVPSEEFFGTLSYLMLGLQAILTCKEEYWEKGKKRAVTMMIQTVYNALHEEMNKNGK